MQGKVFFSLSLRKLRRRSDGCDRPGSHPPDEECQVRVFRQQIQLARDLGKPLVLHVRAADERAFAIMEEVGVTDLPAHACMRVHCCIAVIFFKVPAPPAASPPQSSLPRDWHIHMHCFSEDWSSCERWMRAWPNMKFGFTPNRFSRQVVSRLPPDKFLLETDAPYFKPRGVSKRVFFFPLQLSPNLFYCRWLVSPVATIPIPDTWSTWPNKWRRRGPT